MTLLDFYNESLPPSLYATDTDTEEVPIVVPDEDDDEEEDDD